VPSSIDDYQRAHAAFIAQLRDRTATDLPNTPAGNITATTVQAAINELDSKKAKVGALASSGITGAAASGANADITSMTGLTTALSVAQGGTGATTAAAARTALEVTSGSYSPTLTLGANAASSGAYSMNYIRVGNVVTVGARFDMASTAVNTVTTLYFSLPIASNLAATDLTGNATNYTEAARATGNFRADATNDRAQFDVYPGDTVNRGYFGQFMYVIK
jgi:hypothetical protein